MNYTIHRFSFGPFYSKLSGFVQFSNSSILNFDGSVECFDGVLISTVFPAQIGLKFKKLISGKHFLFFVFYLFVF